MNTAVIVEPRDLERLPIIIHKFQKSLKSWKIVFYCGKSLKEKWTTLLDPFIEIRELDVNNLTAESYSDLFKSNEFWSSLYGEFVLVFQADTWILNDTERNKYTIDFFMNKNVSYIGGNMNYRWNEIKFKNPFPTYNGGLSLRKRAYMIKIIEAFPPVKTRVTSRENDSIEGMAEDVYFVAGCYKLGLPLGDTDEDFDHFAIHTKFYNEAFGVHNPDHHVKMELFRLYPDIKNAYV